MAAEYFTEHAALPLLPCSHLNAAGELLQGALELDLILQNSKAAGLVMYIYIYILGLYWVCWDNGKENGNYYVVMGYPQVKKASFLALNCKHLITAVYQDMF